MSSNITAFVGACHCVFVLAAILKWLAVCKPLPSSASFAEDCRGPSGIGRGKSIGLTEGILLPEEAVDSNRSRH